MDAFYVIVVIFRRPFIKVSDNIRVALTEFITIIGIGLQYQMKKDVSEDEDERYL